MIHVGSLDPSLMSRLGCSLQTRMRLEVEIEGRGMGDGTVDHQAGDDIASLVNIICVARVLSEESHVVLQVS